MIPLITSPKWGLIDGSNIKLFENQGFQICSTEISENGFLAKDLSDLLDPDTFFVTIVSTNRICIMSDYSEHNYLLSMVQDLKEAEPDCQIMASAYDFLQFKELVIAGATHVRIGPREDFKNSGGCTTNFLRDLNFAIHHKKTVTEKQVDLNISEEYIKKFSNVVIIADNISPYVNQLRRDKLGNRNAYAAILNLLRMGADAVMLDTVLAQTFENAAPKQIRDRDSKGCMNLKEYNERFENGENTLDEEDFVDRDDKNFELVTFIDKHKQIPIRWSLGSWLDGMTYLGHKHNTGIKNYL